MNNNLMTADSELAHVGYDVQSLLVRLLRIQCGVCM